MLQRIDKVSFLSTLMSHVIVDRVLKGQHIREEQKRQYWDSNLNVTPKTLPFQGCFAVN